MCDILSEWKYTDLVPEDRRAALSAPCSFEELVRLVVADSRGIQARACRGSDCGLTDCFQPIFTLELPDTGDRLFNGPWGYRSQYWESPSCGLAANCELLASLAPKLLGAIDTTTAPELSKIDVCASIHAASAKIWIREGLCLLLEPPSLAVERWVAEAKHGVELARWGLVAPAVTKFEVKGALLDPYGNEVVPVRKIRRHYDIYHYGFS